MKKLKKSLSIVLALVMVLSIHTISFAAKTQEISDVQIVELLGMLKGDNDGVTEEYLAKRTTRLQAAIMFLRLKGLENEAKQYRGKETFVDSNDITWLEGKAIMAYLKANPHLGWQGNTKGEFNPRDVVSAQEYCKVMLSALGYEHGVDFEWNEVFKFAESKGLTKASSIQTFTNRDIASLTVEALKANNNKGNKLVDELVSANIIDSSIAEQCGLLKTFTIEDIKSAMALNSKVVEIKLTNPVDAVDASVFKIKTDNMIMEVVSAEVAPWDKNNKTVLVLLEDNLKAGTLYSVTSGDTTINFGGKSTDIKKPKISQTYGTDFNEFVIEFSEAVRIDNLKVTSSEKYLSRKSLDIVGIEYLDNKTVRVITSDQRGSTLYGITVSGATDLAGNVMDTDDDKSFVGKAKSTANQAISRADAIDYNKIYIEFKTNVDFDSLDQSTFKLEETYHDVVVNVFGAEQATTVEAAEFDSSYNSEASKANAIKKGVVLTVDGTMKPSTLYKVTVDGLRTLYGKAMSSSKTDKESTFVGKPKPTGAFSFAANAVVPTSASSLKVYFQRKVEKDLAEDIGNYEIKRTYITDTSLAIYSAELLEDGKTVKLNVSEMENQLYTLTISDLVDIYGNSQETGTKASTSFVGQKKEARITSITSITRITDTDIKVIFNSKVGTNATDVALYTIDRGVGYPETVTTDNDNPNAVILTIPKTTETVSYRLTVKGLYNADGVAMDSSGATGVFTGRGIAQGLPAIQAAFSTDRQTVKIYFDRDVTDRKIKGVLWGINAEDDVAPFFMIKQSGTSNSFTTLSGLKAYQDVDDRNALIVVDDNPSWDTGYGYNSFIFDLAANYDNRYVSFDNNNTELIVPSNNLVYANPTIAGVEGIDSQTIKVYFSKPVANFNGSAIQLRRTSDNSPVSITKDAIAIVGTSNREWYIPIDTAMQSVSYTATFRHGYIHDKYANNVTLSELPYEQHNRDFTRPLAGNGTNVTYITSVYGIMKDDRTIDVHFTEPMNYDRDVIDNNQATSTQHQNVDNITSYRLRDRYGNTMTGNLPNIKYIEYDERNTKATIYLDNAIDSSISLFGLVIDTNMASMTGNKTIARAPDNNGDLVVQVVNNKYEINRGPKIANAAVSGDRMQLQVGMDSAIAFGDGSHSVDTDGVYTTIDEFVNKITNDTVSASNPKTKTLNVTEDILKALRIVTTFVGGNEKTVSANDVNNINIGIDGKTLTFTFNKAIAAGANGYVTTKTNDTTNNTDLYNYSMMKRSKTDYESKVSFGAPNSGIFDYYPPNLVQSECVAYDTDNDGKINKIEVGFNEELRTVGILRNALSAITIDGVNELTNVDNLTINNNKIVINMKNTVGIGTGTVNVSFNFNDTNSISDNNNNKINGAITVSIDSFVPKVVNITTASPSDTYSTGDEIDITVSFSENVDVIGIPAAKPTLLLSDNIGEVNYTSGTGTRLLTFKYTVKPGDNSSDLDVAEIKLNGASIKDSSNNNANLSFANNLFKDAHDIVIDSPAVVVNSITTTKTNGAYKEADEIPITVHFTEIVKVTGTPILNLSSGGTATYLTGSDSQDIIFTYTIQSGQNSNDLDVIDIDLNGGTIKSADGVDDAELTVAANTFSGSHNVVIDTTKPTIEDITTTSENKTYTNGEEILITVDFSEVVNITGTPTIKFTGINTKADYISGTTTDKLLFRYIVGENDNSNDLNIEGIETISSTIQDSALNNADTTLNGAFSDEHNIVIDNNVATINNITTSIENNTYKESQVIPITVHFTEIVKITGAPTLSLSSGGTATYLTGSDSQNIVFTYTVVAGENSSDLNVTSIQLNDGTIKSNNNNDANLEVASNALSGSYDIVIDTTKPTINSISITDGIYKKDDLIQINVTFSEDVNVTDTPAVTLSDSIGNVDYATGTGSTTLTFDYTVLENQNSNDLTITGLVGTIKDRAGNDIVTTIPSKTYNVVIDTTAPSMLDATDLDGLVFSNSSNKVIAIAEVAASVAEKGKLQVAFANDKADIVEGNIGSSTLDDDMRWNTSEPDIITSIPEQTAGLKIFYRLIDQVGNASEWVEDGTVVTPLGDLTTNQTLEGNTEKDGFTYIDKVDTEKDTIIGNDIITKVRGEIRIYGIDGETTTLIDKKALTAGTDSNHASFEVIELDAYKESKSIKITLVDDKGNESAYSNVIELDAKL
ncbi:hypothetical protein AN1V17_14890 [Vallitalea sediminicola]